MIRVARAPEPPHFDAVVRQEGLRWLREKHGAPREPRQGGRVVPLKSGEVLRPSQLEDYWTLCLPDLRRLYHGYCAYAGIEIQRGGETVDHFEPKSTCLTDPAKHAKIYDWHNFRLAFRYVNGAKGDRLVLDPFEIGDGWFTLEFVAFQVLPSEALDESLRERVQATITNLDLNGRWLCALREEHFESWDAGECSLDSLRRVAPFVAREIERQRLTPSCVEGWL